MAYILKLCLLCVCTELCEHLAFLGVVQICSSLSSSLPRATGPARSLCHCGFPTGSQPPLGIHLLGILLGAAVGSASPWTFMGCRSQAASPWSAPRTAGNLSSVTWNTTSPSSFSDLGVCRVACHTHSHSPLPAQCCCAVISLCLKYTIPEALPLLMMGSAWVRSILEPSVIDSIAHAAAFHRSHPCSLPNTKTGLCEPNTEFPGIRFS